MYVGSHVVGRVGVIGDLAGLQLQTGCVGCRPWQVSCMDPDYYVVGRPRQVSSTDYNVCCG